MRTHLPPARCGTQSHTRQACRPQLLACAHCSTERWPPNAAQLHVSSFQGESLARAQCSRDRWSPYCCMSLRSEGSPSVLPKPLQCCQPAATRRAAARPHIPRAAPCACPLQQRQVTRFSCLAACACCGRACCVPVSDKLVPCLKHGCGQDASRRCQQWALLA